MAPRDPVLASDIKQKPIEWLWENRIPKGMTTVIAGRRDQGKGLFATYVAADISRRGGNVIYSAIEDGYDTMTAPRLEAAGADMRRILAWRFMLPIQQRQLEQLVIENDIKLVVIDPFASHLSGGITRSGDSVRQVTDAVSELAEDTGCSFLIVEHIVKWTSSKTHPADAIAGGGSGLASSARAAYIFGKDPKDADRRLLCPVKLNVAEFPKALAFELDIVKVKTAKVHDQPALLKPKETEAHASLLLSTSGERTPGRPPDKRAAISEWLIRKLYASKDPLRGGDVIEDAKQAGLPQRTLERAVKELGIVKAGGGRATTWALPPKLRARLDKATKVAPKAKKGGKK